MSAIEEAPTFEIVVELINDREKDSQWRYYGGGYDSRSGETFAAEWAFDCAVENGYVDQEEIEATLDILIQGGAEFDYEVALEKAMEYIDDMED